MNFAQLTPLVLHLVSSTYLHRISEELLFHEYFQGHHNLAAPHVMTEVQAFCQYIIIFHLKHL
jgi:hypothetical protein